MDDGDRDRRGVVTDVWQAQANCRGLDPALFFPISAESTAETRAVCQDCVVRELCLQYALDNRENHGLWGGLAASERRSLYATRPRGRECRQCGTMFFAPMKTGFRYCSDECRLQGRQASIARSRARARAA